MTQIMDSETATQPSGGWTDNRVLSSDVQQAGGSAVGARVSVVFEDIEQEPLPLGNPGFELRAVVEEEVAPGVFVPFARQHEPINADVGQKTRQVIVLTQQPVFDQGIAENITDDTAMNRVQIDKLPDKYRVCIVRKEIDPAKADLQSITASIYVTES